MNRLELLTAKEVAQLKGCTVRTVQLMARSGKIPCQEDVNENNRKQFLFPLDALEPQYQARYYRKKHGEV
ncbi:MAG: helix-turn-helix domain-containing protein, partial [Faecalispora jeddahensis]